MNTTRSTLGATALLTLMITLAGCAATAADAAAPGTTAPITATAVAPTPTATPDPWESVRSMGVGVYRVVDSDLLGELLGTPNGQSYIAPGADLTIDDGDLVALGTEEYGSTISLQILDLATHNFSTPEATFVFWVTDVADLEAAGTVESIPRG